ncbi:MAG: tRNA lysidine(34) synthetase TilS [Bacilli bacterium]|jgi:tRNA(Ile)-lysidine synthase|nr:tRNA lysidine(34) synthetase TilS [Bacilli bacterium]
MKINYQFAPQENYLIACSFGPDSMALLHTLLKYTRNVIVCHVNYHQRKESDEEEKSLKEYCIKEKIIFESVGAPKQFKGNFQAKAREFRYTFFKQIYQKYNAKSLFIAHQQDDVIETYLMQKQRKTRVKQYGLAEKSYFLDMKIIRPFLIYSKKDIYDYCRENLVPYSLDSSNFETKYLRNKIRLEVVEKLSVIERHQVLNDVKKDNENLTKLRRKLLPLIDKKGQIEITKIIDLKNEQFQELIYLILDEIHYPYSISKKLLSEIKKITHNDKPNITLFLRDNYVIIKEYNLLLFVESKVENSYNYEIKKPSELVTPYFELDFSFGAEDRNILDDDYPLTIRTYKKGDVYQINNYFVQVRRLYIDWKMPLRLRNLWPIIVNKKGEIIYIPRYRKDFIDQHQSKFIIKIDSFIE